MATLKMTIGYQDSITDERINYTITSFGNFNDNEFNKIVRHEMRLVEKTGADISTFSYFSEIS